MLPNLVTRKRNQLTTFNFCVFIVLQIINKINHFSVGFVNASIVIINVYVGNSARAVTESPRYSLFRYAYFVRD